MRHRFLRTASQSPCGASSGDAAPGLHTRPAPRPCAGLRKKGCCPNTRDWFRESRTEQRPGSPRPSMTRRRLSSSWGMGGSSPSQGSRLRPRVGSEKGQETADTIAPGLPQGKRLYRACIRQLLLRKPSPQLAGGPWSRRIAADLRGNGTTGAAEACGTAGQPSRTTASAPAEPSLGPRDSQSPSPKSNRLES